MVNPYPTTTTGDRKTDLQNTFNTFVRTGGKEIVLMFPNIKAALSFSLDEENSIERMLYRYGNYEIGKAVCRAEALVLTVHRGNENPKHEYSYTYNENDFVVMDMGVSEELEQPSWAVRYNKYAGE